MYRPWYIQDYKKQQKISLIHAEEGGGGCNRACHLQDYMKKKTKFTLFMQSISQPITGLGVWNWACCLQDFKRKGVLSLGNFHDICRNINQAITGKGSLQWGLSSSRRKEIFLIFAVISGNYETVVSETGLLIFQTKGKKGFFTAGKFCDKCRPINGWRVCKGVCHLQD